MSIDIDSDYKIGQDNINPLWLNVDNPVFIISAVTIILFVAFSLIFHTESAQFFT